MILSKIKSYFFTGLIFILPLLAVFYLALFLLGIVDGVMRYIPLPEHVQGIPMFNVVVFCLVIFILGWLVTTVLGKILMRWVDGLIDTLPVIRNLFSLIKHAMLSLMSENSEHFRYVVLVEYPSAGLWSLGFVSRLVKYDVEKYVDPDNTVSVFFPTSPNPSSGMLVFISVSKIHILDLSLTEAINIIMSAGIYCPTTKFAGSNLLPEKIAAANGSVKNTVTVLKSNDTVKVGNKVVNIVKKAEPKKSESKKAPTKTPAAKAPTKAPAAKVTVAAVKSNVTVAPAKKQPAKKSPSKS